MPDRHPGLLAAANATANWVRARRAAWGEAPVEARVAAPVHTSAPARDSAITEALMLPLALDSPESDAFAPIPALSDAATDARPLGSLTTDDDAPAICGEPETALTLASDANTLFAPASTRSFGSIAGPRARALIEAILPWWPRVAMVAVLLVLAATARVYWPRLTAPRPGLAVLESVPDGSQIIVDGTPMGTTPLSATLPAGPHSVEFQFRKATRIVRLTIASGGRTVGRVDWTRKPSGRLQVHTDPPGATVSVDGVARGVTPLTLDDLTVGPHALVLARADSSIERTVTVNATEIARVNETIFPGWITVFSPFALNITERSRPIRLDDRNQVMLPSGSHDLRFENRALGYEEVRRVDVRSGGVTTLSVVPPPSSLTVTATAPAEVWLDGAAAGQTPLTALPVELGTREVVVRTADGDERRFTVIVTTKPATLDVSFPKPAS